MKKLTYLLTGLLIVILVVSCAVENDLDPTEKETVSSNPLALQIQSELQLLSDSNFKKLTTTYGNPNWEFCFIQNLGAEKTYVIPLEQHGIITTLLKYQPLVNGKSNSEPEIINALSIANSNTIKRYDDSFLFYLLQQKKAKVNEDALVFAKEAIVGKAKHLKSEVSNYNKRPLNLTKRIVNSGYLNYEILINSTNFYINGRNCSADQVYFEGAKITLTSEMNGFIRNYNASYGEEIFLENSAYFNGNSIVVEIECGVDSSMIYEHMQVFMQTFAEEGLRYMVNSCNLVTGYYTNLLYHYYLVGGSCEGAPVSSDPNYSYGGGGLTPAPTPTNSTEDEEKIDNNNLQGKEGCLNGLLDQKGNSFVKDIFSQFTGESEFDIVISSEEHVYSNVDGVYKEVNGLTKYTEGTNQILININTSFASDRTNLEVVRTILHEYIHADIFRKLNTKNINSEILDFKSTLAKYEDEHHSAMADLYLNAMANALKEFHINVLTQDYQNYINYYGEAPTDLFYEAIAWGGLKDNDVDKWVDLPQDEKDAINALRGNINMLSKISPCQ